MIDNFSSPFIKDDDLSLLLESSIKTCANQTSGLLSKDESAVVGQDGWLFIFDGGNGYRDSYLYPVDDLLINSWVELINNRSSFFNGYGIPFCQLIVPNKLSLIRRNFPFDLRYELTPCLSGILKNSKVSVLTGLSSVFSNGVESHIYRRADSHFSIFGNAFYAKLILDHFDIFLPNMPKIEYEVVNNAGDLGSKFEPPIEEKLAVPSWNRGIFSVVNSSSVEKSEDFIDGVVSFYSKSSNFIIDKRIVIVGNSFFDRAVSWGLSPFFVSLFREVYFIWSPGFDLNFIKDINPDFVVFQTCERFLKKVASDD